MVLAGSGHLTLSTELASSLGSNVAFFVGLLSLTCAWPGRGFRRAVMKLQLHHGFRVALGSFGQLFVNRLDQVLLVGIVAPKTLGYYAIAATVMAFSALIAEGLSVALFPRLRHSDDG